jgi:hypothetical protein
MSGVSRARRARRSEAGKAIAFGIALPVFLIALALIQQGQMKADAGWWAPVLAFVVGAGVNALPRGWVYPGLPVAAIASVLLTWVTAFNGVTFICFVLAGFAFGLAARSLIAQLRAASAPASSRARIRATWAEGDDHGSLDAPEWRDVEARIRAMDGAAPSTLSIVNGRDTMDVLCVRQAGFLVFSTQSSGRTRALYQALPQGSVSPDPRDTVDVVIAGRSASYPKGRFITREDALVAAKAFLATGTRDETLGWDVGSRTHEIPVPPGVA